MMCDQPKVQLYLYLDGELAAPEAEAFEAHLRTCSSCKDEAEKHHRLQAFARILRDREVARHQKIRKRLLFAPADTTAELVELREAETVGAVDDDRIYI